MASRPRVPSLRPASDPRTTVPRASVHTGHVSTDRARALGAWAHGKLTRKVERIGMVGGKEVLGTEPREVRTGGRAHHLPRPRPFRSPRDVRADSLGEARCPAGVGGPWGPSLDTIPGQAACGAPLAGLAQSKDAGLSEPSTVRPPTPGEQSLRWVWKAPKGHRGGSRSHLRCPPASGQVNSETIQDVSKHIGKSFSMSNHESSCCELHLSGLRQE